MRRSLFFVLSPLLLALAVALVAPAAPRAVAQVAVYALTILHTSENHGHWEPYTQTISLGGIARRATLVKQARSEAGNSLLLDAGDVAQGTLYFIQHRMTEGAQFYNALGYDGVAIGNHEFDLGPKTFAENWVVNAKFSIVSTNLDFSADPLLAGRIPASVVKMVGGEKIGLLGFTTEDVAFNSSMGPSIAIKPRVDAANAAIAELQRQGVNKIIALSHLGYPEDMKLAAAVDGIDVIVSGHTFTLLGDPTKLDKALGTPEGPYPTVVNSPGGSPVLIVHAYQWGALLGRLTVTFDAEGVPAKWVGAPILVDAKVPDDPDILALQQKLAEPLLTFRQTVIGKTDVDLEGTTRIVRTQETNLGDLVADAMLEATQGDKTQAALVNGGGIRTTIKAGDITIGSVLETLPFGNRLVQMDVKGADLLAALENGVSRISDVAGRFPQVAGLRFAFDTGKPAGQRVSRVEIASGTAGFQLLDPGATYRIVTNDFMAGGGDGFDVLKNGTNVRGGDVPLDSALLGYIKAHAAFSPRTDGRIMQAPAPTPARPPATPTPVATATSTQAANLPAVAQTQATPTLTSVVAQANQRPATGATPAAGGASTPSPNVLWLALLVAAIALYLVWDWRRRARR